MTAKEKQLIDDVVKAAESRDRVAHWKAVYKLLRHTNKTARKEQDKIAEECAGARKDKTYKKTKTKALGLRFGVAMPPMTYNALVEADTLAYGRSDLRETRKEEFAKRDATNSVVRDLELAFPQFKVS